MGRFVQLGDVHRLTNIDAAAAEQDYGSLLVLRWGVLGEQVDTVWK